jgi:hypothetical protein
MDAALAGYRRADCVLCESLDRACGKHLRTAKPVTTELRFRSGIEFPPLYPAHPADAAIVPGEFAAKIQPGGLRTFESGATRSMDADNTRYDLIPPAALEALASTYAEGAALHGDHNYLKGMPYSVVVNHLLRHINLWQRGDASENHLGHAAWGLCALLEFEAEGRGEELNDLYPWN